VTAPSFHPYTERHGPDDAAVARYMDAVRRTDAAMAKANMLVGMVCENMVAGRDSFFGTSQFLDGSDPFEKGRRESGDA
jgi:hypothetical protein